MKILILNGAPRSGKGEFAKYIGAYQDSMVNDVKATAIRDHGWDGSKTDENRRLLSDIKAGLDARGRAIIRGVVRRALCAQSVDVTYYTIDARESKDIDALVEIFRLLGLPVATVLIRRAAAEAEAVGGCAADTEVLNYCYDYEIRNDGTLPEFWREIDGAGVMG